MWVIRGGSGMGETFVDTKGDVGRWDSACDPATDNNPASQRHSAGV